MKISLGATLVLAGMGAESQFIKWGKGELSVYVNLYTNPPPPTKRKNP